MNWIIIAIIAGIIIISGIFVVYNMIYKDRDYPGYILGNIMGRYTTSVETADECKKKCQTRPEGCMGYSFTGEQDARNCQLFQSFKAVADVYKRYPCKVKSNNTAACGVIKNKEVPDCELCTKDEHDRNQIKDYPFTVREFREEDNECTNEGGKCQGTNPKPYTGFCTKLGALPKTYCFPSPYKVCRPIGDNYYWENSR